MSHGGVVISLQKNMNALHYVAQHGHDREARMLLEAGVNTDTVDNVSTSSKLQFVLFAHLTFAL